MSGTGKSTALAALARHGELILDCLARVEPLLRATCTHELDASRPLGEVVAALIAIGAA
jgi:hypothetical protein